ncbi:hypothetical protein L6V77_09175 [Myxococcota bacterium]|nr:hypothetical protein [Myxococcota bacterium]
MKPTIAAQLSRGRVGARPAAVTGLVLSLGLSLASTPAAAFERPTLRLTLRGSLGMIEDEQIDVLSDDALVSGGSLGVDAFFGDRLLVGLDWTTRGVSGEVFEAFDTALEGQSVRLSAGWRWRPLAAVQLYARGGVGAWWWALEFDERYGPDHLEASAFRPGFHIGAGADVWLWQIPVGEGDGAAAAEPVGIGLSAELTYDRSLPVAFESDGRSIGTLDPSGPGGLIGLTLQF